MQRRNRLWIGLGLVTLLLLVLICWWLSRTAPVRPQLRAQRQLRGLVYLIYPLAILAVPYLFRLLCAEQRRSSATWRGYLGALWAPLVFLACALWIGWSSAVLDVALLLLGFCLALSACADLFRLAGPNAGQLVPSLIGFLMLGSVFIGGQAVENAPSEESRARRIDLGVQVNPLSAACARIDRFDLLRTSRIYGATPIGALYVYRFPDWRRVLEVYLIAALTVWLVSLLLRFIVNSGGDPGPQRPEGC